MYKLTPILRNLFIISVIIVLILAFSSSYTSSNFDNLAYVIAIGIDKGTAEKSYQVSFQIGKPSAISESGSTDDEPAVINTVEANSLDNAINLMNAYIGKQINLSHCKLIVFSEEVASDGISSSVYTLINNTQIRPSTNLIISKTNAKFYIENSKPSLESLPTKYYEIFPNSSKYTGYTVDATLGDFFNGISCPSCEPYAILGGMVNENLDDFTLFSSSDPLSSGDIKSNETNISGKRATENIGLAVFKSDKLVGELNAIETVCFCLIRGETNGFLITVPDPDNGEKYIDLYMYPNDNIKSKVEIINDTPFISVDLKLNARIYSVTDDSDYLDAEVLERISESASSFLKLQMTNYLYKTSKTFNSDIHGFGKKALSKFLTINEFSSYNWLENYQNTFFKVNTNVSVKSGGLITET